MKKKKRSQVLPVIILLVIIGISGAISLPALYRSMSQSNTRFYTLPRINAAFTTDDGATHYVQTDLSLAIDKSKAKDVNITALHKQISGIVQELDYDKIIGRNSMEYIKEEIERELAQHMNPEDLHGVYIAGIETGDGLPPASAGTNEKRNDIFRGLFQNIN